MVQVAAALLFALAAGLGLMVILAMLKTNADAILSALVGEGAFPVEAAPHPGPAATVITLRHAVRRDVARPVTTRPQLSRAA